MRSNYPGKSHKLNDLLAEATRFFSDKGLFVSTEKNDPGKVISVYTDELARNKILDICLGSDANGSLLVTFAGVEESLMIRSPSLTSMIGGGFLTLRWHRLAENLERLENEFWEVVDKFMVSS
jgi:hypothetical protein